MSSVMLAADSTAIKGRYPQTAAQPALPARKGASLWRRVQGIAAGVFFLATRIPFYFGVLLFGVLISLAGVVLYLLRAIGLRLTRPAGTVAAAVLALVSVAGPRQAKADTVGNTVLLEQTTPVFSQQTNLYTFDAPGAGTLSVTLNDWVFPVDLQQLSASILFQDQSWSLTPVQGSQNPEWVLDLPISSGGVFGAFVAAEAGSFRLWPDGRLFHGHRFRAGIDRAAAAGHRPPARRDGAPGGGDPGREDLPASQYRCHLSRLG